MNFAVLEKQGILGLGIGFLLQQLPSSEFKIDNFGFDKVRFYDSFTKALEDITLEKTVKTTYAIIELAWENDKIKAVTKIWEQNGPEFLEKEINIINDGCFQILQKFYNSQIIEKKNNLTTAEKPRSKDDHHSPLATDILGSSECYMATPYGSIDVKFARDTVKICIKYFKTNKHLQRMGDPSGETKITMQLFTLEQLQNSPFFLKDFDESIRFNYLHDWTMSQIGNEWIIYADQNELAIKLTSTSNDIEEDLLKLTEISRCCNLSFFREMAFDFLVREKLGLTIDQLRKMANMNREKLAYFSHHAPQISKLIENGMTLTNLLSIDFEKLQKIVELSSNMDHILQFVTINQIVGVDHIPPKLPMQTKQGSEEEKSWSLYGGGGSGKFSYTHGLENNKFVINYNNKAKCEYLWSQLQDKEAKDIKNEAGQIKAVRYLHHWITIPFPDQPEKRITFYYSQDTQTLIKESCDESFPIEELLRDHFHILAPIPYFQEKMRENFLLSQSYCFEKMRALPSMTEAKLDALTRYHYDTEKLLKSGISMNDLAQADEKRLASVLENFCKIEKVLELVSAKELLGLNAPNNSSLGLFNARNYSPSIFSSFMAPSNPENRNNPQKKGWPCTLI